MSSDRAGAAHAGLDQPSPWVARFVALMRCGGTALDLAAGHGRHARLLAAAGLAVEAVDRDAAALAALRGIAGIVVREADLEAGVWPYPEREFDVVVVTNYLWRPLLPHLSRALAPGGVLVYETFGAGNEKLGKPSNPQFLLEPGELLALARDTDLAVVAYECGFTAHPKPAMVQRICARRCELRPGVVPAPATLDTPRPPR